MFENFPRLPGLTCGALQLFCRSISIMLYRFEHQAVVEVWDEYVKFTSEQQANTERYVWMQEN